MAHRDEDSDQYPQIPDRRAASRSFPRSQERRPRNHGPGFDEVIDLTDVPLHSTHRRTRRRSRKHAERPPEPELDYEDSDDVLAEHFGGVVPPSDDDLEPTPYDSDDLNIHLPGYPGDYNHAAFASADDDDNEVHITRPSARRRRYLTRPPHSTRPQGLWLRAAAPSFPDGPLSLHLKVVVTRSGERYKSRSIPYTKGTWDDIIFAHRLKEEYRILKATKIGFTETIASYAKILFVYFRQYRATSSRTPSGRFDGVKWDVKVFMPITIKDDDSAKTWFMYQLQKLARLRSRWEEGGIGRKVVGPRVWVSRLDTLVEPGAVIDVEVQETFDVTKICVGLLVAILVSLAIALAYGFATKEKDFSTGFSIASWIITAAGFFAAIVALFGDESRSAAFQNSTRPDERYRSSNPR
jgi:hypothetical protein